MFQWLKHEINNQQSVAKSKYLSRMTLLKYLTIINKEMRFNDLQKIKILEANLSNKNWVLSYKKLLVWKNEK